MAYAAPQAGSGPGAEALLHSAINSSSAPRELHDCWTVIAQILSGSFGPTLEPERLFLLMGNTVHVCAGGPRAAAQPQNVVKVLSCASASFVRRTVVYTRTRVCRETSKDVVDIDLDYSSSGASRARRPYRIGDSILLTLRITESESPNDLEQ